MSDHNKAKEINFSIDTEIEKVPTTLPEAEYQKAVYNLENKKVDVPKVNVFTRGIAFLAHPMCRLALYVLFIFISGWLIKRNLKKTDDSDEDQDEERDDRPSKKERKILKKWSNYGNS